MRRTCLLLLMIAIVFSVTLVAQAHYEYQLCPVEIDATRVDTPITVDGVLNESVWSVAEEGELSFAEGVNDPSVFYKFKVLYDDNFIYLAIVVQDSKLSVPKGGPGLWNADSLEICFDFPHEAVYQEGVYRFVVAPIPAADGQPQIWLRASDDTVGEAADDYIEMVAVVDDQGYVIEMCVDLHEVDFAPAPKATIGFQIAANNTEGEERTGIYVWSGTAHYFYNATLFGDLIFR